MKWNAPGCRFSVDCADHVLEQIRSSCMEGLFAAPHGGVETGGVMAGTIEGQTLRVQAALPLDCEHAMGPSFTLSGKDHARLAALLKEGFDSLRAAGYRPLGWYRSTRGAISLLQRDLDLHDRYFPDPNQIILMVRPHAFQPMRAGFFFRESDGCVQATASHQEFILESRRVPAAEPSQPSSQTPHRHRSNPSPSLAWLAWVTFALGVALGRSSRH